MTHLLIVILDDLERMPALLQAWRAVGLPGANILESIGDRRAITWLGRVGLGALDRLFEADEVRRRTLLAAVEDEQLLDQAIAEAERVVGGFDRPNSGLLLALPIAQARGLRKIQPMPRQAVLPPAVRPDWMIPGGEGRHYPQPLHGVYDPAGGEPGGDDAGRAALVVASLAEQSGHPIYFRTFLRYGVVKTLLSLVLASLYVWVRYL
jgi:hypothetical protein